MHLSVARVACFFESTAAEGLMIAAIWLCKLKLVLLRMLLCLASMPLPSKIQLMVELIRLEVYAAKVLEKSLVKLFRQADGYKLV